MVVGAIAFILLLVVAVLLFQQGQPTLSLLVIAAVIVLSAAVLGLAHIVREVFRLPATLLQAGSDAVRGVSIGLVEFSNPRSRFAQRFWQEFAA